MVHYKNHLVIGVILVLATGIFGLDDSAGAFFRGHDLHIRCDELIRDDDPDRAGLWRLRGDVSISIGPNRYQCEDAVVWVARPIAQVKGVSAGQYNIAVYLSTDLRADRGSSTLAVVQELQWSNQAGLLHLQITGQIFITATKQTNSDITEMVLYQQALRAKQQAAQPQPIAIQDAAEVPRPKTIPGPDDPALQAPTIEDESVIAPPEPISPVEQIALDTVQQPAVSYPVNLNSASQQPLEIESTKLADGSHVAVVRGRIYVWQKLDEKGGLLELLADNAVVFYQSGSKPFTETAAEGDVPGSGRIDSIYLQGDVEIIEGIRSIRADEVFYNFRQNKAIAVDAELKTFDTERNIPVYIRAARLKQVCEHQFTGEDITLTTSEFHEPQLSFKASKIILTDRSRIDEAVEKMGDSRFEARMENARFLYYDKQLLQFDEMSTNLARPDVPIESVNAGYDSSYGPSVESRWNLARVLGLREVPGTEGVLMADYYGDRGGGGGAEVQYTRQSYFGNLLGYAIHDHGEDDLGRIPSRENIDPPRKLRGCFQFQHRHFLEDNWQVTTETSYLSDETFLEEYYRGEFNTEKEQETLVHFKRITDNQGISILGKGRINYFADKLEETPSVEYHLTGQSLWDDTLTFYSDTQVSRFRQQIGDDHATVIDEDNFTFAFQRSELDMPLRLGVLRLVPYIAGTFGYDDRSGFRRSLVNGSNTGTFGQDSVWIGEVGMRAGTQFWKVYPDVRSEIWDLNRLRHVIEPEITAVAFDQSTDVFEQRNILNVGLMQRLQTKRGPQQDQKTVDWMTLELDLTWVNDSAGADAGPDRFIWNQPFVPMRVYSAPEIFNGDLTNTSLHRVEEFGPRRNNFTADYLWRLSDTSAVLADTYYDLQSGVIQQVNAGYTRLRWPNLSYYFGNRYLRRTSILNEKGSNAFIFSATYKLDPRYTVVFSQAFDFDYGVNLSSEISLIRRYHRLFYAFTASVDRSLDRQAIMISIWPQGVGELALGQRRFMDLGGSAGF